MMRLRAVVALVGLVALSGLAGCGGGADGPAVGEKVDAQTKTAELATLTGTWDYTSHTALGEATVPGKNHLVFNGAQMVMEVYNGEKRLPPVNFTIHVDPTMTPKQMDLDARLPTGTKRWPAIYKIEGGTLTICYRTSGDRPKDFAAEGTTYLSVLKKR